MSPAQQMRKAGVLANLRVRGRLAITNTDETLKILVDDRQPLDDPTSEAKRMGAVFAAVTIAAGAVKQPREVETFKETESGRVYSVISFDENAADGVTWKFTCEAHRENPVEEAD